MRGRWERRSGGEVRTWEMAPAKSGRRNNRHEKGTTTATRTGRRPVGFAFSKLGRLAALHGRARRKAVVERWLGRRKKKDMCNPINSLLVRHPVPSTIIVT